MTEHFILPDRLDSSAAPALVAALGQKVGQPLQIDAAGVEVIGALALEVIIAAGLQWQADGQTLAITQRSARFDAACDALGLRADAPWIGTAEPCAEGAA